MVTEVTGVHVDQERKKAGSRIPRNTMEWGGGGGQKMSEMR